MVVFIFFNGQKPKVPFIGKALKFSRVSNEKPFKGGTDFPGGFRVFFYGNIQANLVT